MTKHTIELDYETVDKLVTQSLLEQRLFLLEDYKNDTVYVFDMDPVKDRKRIGEVIKALEKVIDLYSVPGTYKFDELPCLNTELKEIDPSQRDWEYDGAGVKVWKGTNERYEINC